MSFVTYRSKKAYLLIILAVEDSNWSQITFYILTNVLTSIFERFDPNFLANIYTFRWWRRPFRWLTYSQSGVQAGCIADFSVTLLSHHDFNTCWQEGWTEKKTPLHERTHHNLWLLLVYCMYFTVVFKLYWKTSYGWACLIKLLTAVL